MLKITFGLWRSKDQHLYGSFTILGKKFVVFLNDPNTKSNNAPEYSVTIQESHDATESRH